MGLINLLTDPKNFKFYNGGQGYTGDGSKPSLLNIPYGKDRIDGGSSGQPYITSPILYNQNSVTLLKNDFLLRGGTTYPENAAQDVVRLSKMFGDTKSPNGLLFIAKQQLLSRTAVRTQTSGILNEGIYSPLNTLAEAGVVGLGIHLNKQGLNPFATTGAYSNNPNLYGVRVTPEQSILNNRLYGLYNEKILNNKFSTPGLKGFTTNPISLNPLLISYSGGPGSTLGVGKTNIRFADQRTGKNNPLYNSLYFTGINPTGSLINDTPVFLHDRRDISNYIESKKFTGLLSFKIPSNVKSKEIGKNNPLAKTNPTYFYTGSIKSVFIDKEAELEEQQGGLLINTTQSWTNTGNYKVYDRLTSKYVNYNSVLPNFNVNSLQSSGLSLIPKSPNGFTGSISVNSDNKQVGGLLIDTYQPWTTTEVITPDFDVNVEQKYGTILQITGEKSWTPQYDITTKNTSSLTNRVSNTYQTLASGSKINNSGSYNYNVYDSGSLKNNQLINAQGTYTYTQTDLINTPITPGKLSFSPKIQDFRAILRGKTNQSTLGTIENATASGQLTAAPDYTNFNIETRVNIGNEDGSGPGARSGKNYANYTSGSTYLISNKSVGPLDMINALSIYTGSSVPSTTEQPINDLCKFRIAIIDNDTPTTKTFVHFRAFLDSISDAYTAEWNPVKYLGRGENFYTYNGYTRQMSLSWTVAAQSKQELIPMYKKLNYLASSLTPDYSTTGYMRGNLVQLTIGGYVYEQPGIITGLTYTMEETSPWEIGINAHGGFDSSVKELPHIIRVTGFNFIPIQKFRPEIQKGENDYKHYISLADGDNVLDNSYKSLPPKVSTTIVQTPII